MKCIFCGGTEKTIVKVISLKGGQDSVRLVNIHVVACEQCLNRLGKGYTKKLAAKFIASNPLGIILAKHGYQTKWEKQTNGSSKQSRRIREEST